MLVLTRRVGESINIGDGVVLTLLSIDRYQAKLGFLSPHSAAVEAIPDHARVSLASALDHSAPARITPSPTSMVCASDTSR